MLQSYKYNQEVPHCIGYFHSKLEQVFLLRILTKIVGWMTNSEDPDQTNPLGVRVV